MSTYSKLTISYLVALPLLFLSGYSFGEFELLNPMGNGNGESELKSAGQSITQTIAFVVSVLFGMVALATLSQPGFMFVSGKRDEAIEFIKNWVGGVGFYSLIGAFGAALFAGFSG